MAFRGVRNSWFVRKARGGMGAEDRARVLLNRVRYRAATS